MTETAARPQARNGNPREKWTERDHADAYISAAMVPLLELADAFPKMIELVGEHLIARFGNAETEGTRIPDDDVICVWGNLVSFVGGMQEMLAADRPGAMKGMIRLQRVYAEGTWGWPS